MKSFHKTTSALSDESGKARKNSAKEPLFKKLTPASGFSQAGLPAEEGVPLGTVGEKEIAAARTLLSRYRDGKKLLEARIIDNEQWFKLRHWEQLSGEKCDGTENASAWLFNSIANKHADAMDSFPSVLCLAREKSDESAAKMLSEILPVVFERNGFEQIYSDAWWYKLKAGTAVYGIFWNPRKNGTLGDIEIRRIDILNLFWEPGITDLQKSRNLFHVELCDNDALVSEYPFLSGKLSGNSTEIARYLYDDAVDTRDKSPVVDWYYKKRCCGREVLHYCKFTGDTLLYASENDPLYAKRGFYDHARYPFIADTLFPEEGTPCGFGYIDVMKDAQKQIDMLGNAIVKNAAMAANVRYFINSAGAVNEEEFADWTNSFVHVAGSNLGEDSIREIKVSNLSEIYLGILANKVDELKETSGNRDFSQGGVSNGVTAASAIAALQEAGSKLTRDMVKGGYRAFRELNVLAVELIRQFYDEPRFFRILGEDGTEAYVSYDNASILPKPQGSDFGLALGTRQPIFDIKICAEKSSPFSRLSQNELALQLYQAGMFNPGSKEQAMLAIGMMEFEGKAQLLSRLSALTVPEAVPDFPGGLPDGGNPQ